MTVSAAASAALSQARERVDRAAEGVDRATRPSADPQDQVDLSTEAIALVAAHNGYDAATRLAKTADEISRATIDVLA
jgi:flagellar hook protein FlgE